MKLLILLLISSFFTSSFASDNSKQYLARIKAKEIENHLLDSENYKQCYDKITQSDPSLSSDDIKRDVRQCLSDEIKNAQDEDIEKISGTLKIKDVSSSSAKTTDSLKDYLQERIHDAIHGEGSYQNKKLKELKFVDQKQFFTLYEAQIHKNITLELSKYCLENLGTKNGPGNFLNLAASADAVTEINKKMEEGKVVGIDEISLYKEYKLATIDNANKKHNLVKFWEPNITPASDNIYDKSVDAKKFGNVIQEYNFCPKLNTTDTNNPCYYTKARDSKMINHLKKYELDKAKANPEQLAQRFILCSKVVIRNMCEVYRCNNTYDWSAADNTEIGKKVKYCKDELGLTGPTTTASTDTLDYSDRDPNGKIACNLMTRLNDYKNTIDKIAKIKNDLNNDFKVTSGFAVGTTFKDTYKMGQGDGETKIDEITSIASKELTNKVDQFNKNEELAKRCKNDDGSIKLNEEECRNLGIGEEDINKLKSASFQAEAETEAYLKRLEEFKGKNDPESLKKFLREQGMGNYVDKVGQLADDELIDLLKSKYRSDRQAVISSMNDRLYDIINKQDTAQINDQVVSDKVEEIDDNKERVETLFNYTNIVSSYVVLSSQDSSGDQSQRGNNAARNLEAQGIDTYGDDADKAQYQDFFASDTNSDSGDGSDNFYSTSSLINDIGDFATAD